MVVGLIAFQLIASFSARGADSPTPAYSETVAASILGEVRWLERALAELERRQMPVIVGVARHSGPVLVREFGSLKQDRVTAPETLIDLNSITKTVTAMMVLVLVQHKKIRLNETLAEIFEVVPEDKAGITVHQLLTHAAGFRESVGDDAEAIDKAAFLARAFGSRLVAAPGEKYVYSNVGYSILAAIIEARAGKSYEAFLRDDVLAGLKLTNTGYQSVYDNARAMRSARGASLEKASWGGPTPYWNLVGNGGLLSTPKEFVRLRQLLSGGAIVAPSLLHLAHMPHIAENSSGSSHYGYGLVVEDNPKLGRFYWHDGGNDVFSAQWEDYPEQDLILFTAAADSGKGDAFEAMDVLRKHLMDGR